LEEKYGFKIKLAGLKKIGKLKEKGGSSERRAGLKEYGRFITEERV